MESAHIVHNQDHFYSVKLSNKVIVEHLLNYGSFKSTKWNVPMFNSNDEKIEFLRAFYDSEAYVSKYTIRIESVNETGLLQIKHLLHQFGIDSRIYQYKRKNPNWNTNYILSINNRENRVKFLRCIGFYHSRKQKKLLEYIGSTQTQIAAIA